MGQTAHEKLPDEMLRLWPCPSPQLQSHQTCSRSQSPFPSLSTKTLTQLLLFVRTELNIPPGITLNTPLDREQAEEVMGCAEYEEAYRIVAHHNGEIDEMFRILRKESL